LLLSYNFKMSSNSNSVSSSIDMTLLPPSTPSLCIPRVFQNITKERVSFVLKSLNLGEIDHIDMVPRTSESGDKFQRVFIHFKKWGASPEAIRARERVLSGKEIKIIYDEPWFWKVSANRSVSRAPAPPSAPTRSRPRIDDSSDNDDDLCAEKAAQHRPRPAQHRPRPQNRAPSPPPAQFVPSSPTTPPPEDAGAWTKVDYGPSSVSSKPRRKLVIPSKAKVVEPKAKVEPKAEVESKAEVETKEPGEV